MCAARAREIYERQAKERQQTRVGKQPGAEVENFPQLDKGKARDKAGAAFGVSGKLNLFRSNTRKKWEEVGNRDGEALRSPLSRDI